MSDPYSAQTVLLLHMEGDNNSTVFSDRSAQEATVTRYGNTKVLTAQGKWGNGSGYFDGDGDYLSVPDTNCVFSTGDFTIEVWIKLGAVGRIVALVDYFYAGVGGWQIYIDSSGLVNWYQNNPNISFHGTVAVNDNNWHHIAACRAEGMMRIFVDGNVDYSGANTKNHINVGTPVGIGAQIGSRNAAYDFIGYMNDVRITSGVARYTAPFTPPTSRLPDPDPPSAGILSFGYASDVEDGGAYRVTGTVDELGVPGRYRVRLFDRISGRLVRETWSSAEGAYAFQNLAYRYRGYFVVAYDHDEPLHNAAIADLMTPEAMP